MDFSGVSSIFDPSWGDSNATPSSVILANFSRETIWKPPLSCSSVHIHSVHTSVEHEKENGTGLEICWREETNALPNKCWNGHNKRRGIRRPKHTGKNRSEKVSKKGQCQNIHAVRWRRVVYGLCFAGSIKAWCTESEGLNRKTWQPLFIQQQQYMTTFITVPRAW